MDLAQLNDGMITSRLPPVQVSGLADVVAVAGGDGHTIALKSDRHRLDVGMQRIWPARRWHDHGQVNPCTSLGPHQYCRYRRGRISQHCPEERWHCLGVGDRHSYGQLGDGTTTDRSTPVQVSGLTNIAAIAGGGNDTIALKNDGTVWAWGWNYFGQLGDGTTTDRSTPVQVWGHVVAIAGGSEHTIALKDDGTVWAWGGNGFGQLGDGTTTDRSTPIQVTGLTNVVAIAGGEEHTIALKDDGTVWAWGRERIWSSSATERPQTGTFQCRCRDSTSSPGILLSRRPAAGTGTVTSSPSGN